MNTALVIVAIFLPAFHALPLSLIKVPRDLGLFSMEDVRDYQNESELVSESDFEQRSAFSMGSTIFASENASRLEVSSLPTQSVSPAKTVFSSASKGGTISASETTQPLTVQKTMSTSSYIGGVTATNGTDMLNISSSTVNATDVEKVITPTKAPMFTSYKEVFQHTLIWLNDTYTLSILIPVCAGFVFASVIIVTIATCRCIQRKCYRRRIRRKVLPESVKNMRRSDRTRLLAESSDEEF